MAKGRRLTTSRSERLLGTGTNYNNYRHVPYNRDVSEMSEFVEEDVWSMVEDVHISESDHNTIHHHGGGYSGEWTPRASKESEKRRGITDQSDMRHVGGLSLAFDDETPPFRRIVHQFGTTNNNATSGGPRVDRHMATSAPVNVPDWSKILRVDSAESMHDSDEDDRVGDSGMEPPHVYLARSRSKMNAFSVYEGVGRTLKGRDLSRVRDAVWSQTGFEG